MCQSPALAPRTRWVTASHGRLTHVVRQSHRSARITFAQFDRPLSFVRTVICCETCANAPWAARTRLREMRLVQGFAFDALCLTCAHCDWSCSAVANKMMTCVFTVSGAACRDLPAVSTRHSKICCTLPKEFVLQLERRPTLTDKSEYLETTFHQETRILRMNLAGADARSRTQNPSCLVRSTTCDSVSNYDRSHGRTAESWQATETQDNVAGAREARAMG